MRTAIYIFSAIFIILMLWSCSEDVVPPPSVSHPSGWSDKNSDSFHGAKVLATGKESCTGCHGDNYEGGQAGVACADCHGSWPHTSDWTNEASAEFHGTVVKNEGYEDCKSCHGAELDGGWAEVACADCHGTWPHTSDWIIPTSEDFHGKYVTAEGDESCRSCHGENLEGGWSEVACADCHGTWPHSSEWMDANAGGFHGKEVIANGYENCKSCHGDNLDGGWAEVACATCHGTWPHSEDWTNPASENSHGKYVVANTDESCRTCHGENLEGGWAEVACATCHGTWPHSSEWMVKDAAGFHGTEVATNGSEACKSCHGDNLDGGWAEVACATCHGTWPHTSEWMDKNAAGFHGTEVATNGSEACKSCHGENLEGGWAEVACATCHGTWPHASDWMDKNAAGFHGTEVATNGYESCKSCHGENLEGDWTKVACADCHGTWPHTSEWIDKNAAGFHGTEVATNGYESCKSCHGDNLEGDWTNVACVDCHLTWPHTADWIDKNSAGFHGKDVVAKGNESCKSCHGDNFDGGWSSVSCYTCHSTYPHSATWITPKDPQSHGVAIKTAGWTMDACQSCHGADYLGGSSNSACTTCHTETGGPEACNVCHGDASKPVSEIASWAPPEDTDFNTGTGSIGVGAHQAHLTNTNYTTAYTQDCSLCHGTIPAYDDPTHRNGTVNIAFGAPATNNGAVTPHWTSATASCSDSWCHGNFTLRKADSGNQWAYTDSLIVGNNPAMTWNLVGTGQADCGSCHGLPPTGHIVQTTCSNCHATVVDANNNIIDKTKHINGQIDR